MRLVTKDGLDRLQQANPIARLAAERGLDPKRHGLICTARCPFHGSGEVPSLLLFPRTGRFRCTSCGEDGNVFALVVRLDHIDLVAALGRLAERAGLDLDAVMGRG